MIAYRVTDTEGHRGRQRVCGARVAETTTHRVLKAVNETLLGRVRGARAQARARAWNAGARPDTLTLNIEATLLTAHPGKELPAGNYKHGYGFHPLGCWLDRTVRRWRRSSGQGNAGSNTATNQFTVLADGAERDGAWVAELTELSGPLSIPGGLAADLPALAPASWCSIHDL